MIEKMSARVGSEFTLGDASRALGTSSPRGAADVAIAAVCIDSRDAGPGSLFVALEGEHTDGHRYLADAFARGAAGALVRRGRESETRGPTLATDDPLCALGRLAHWHRERFSPRVVAITGSTGKTTCKDFLAACLGRSLCTLKTLGNYNTEIGVPLTLFRLGERHEAAVVELAMRNRGDIAYTAALAAPEMGVLTNVGESHLETLGSIENIARAKGELFSALPERGWAVINAGDAWGEWIAARTPARVRRWARERGEGIEVWAENVCPDRWARVALDICLPRGVTVRVQLPLAGEHHVENALAAAAAADLLGASAEDIRRGIEEAELTGMRMQWQEPGEIYILNDAYNSSPASCRAALATLRCSRVGRRRVAVLGDMLELGARSTSGHREVGRIAARSGLDLLLTVGEESRATGAAALDAGFPGDRYRHFHRRRALIAALSRWIHPGDAVLVKASRGCALETVVEALAREFSAPEGGTP